MLTHVSTPSAWHTEDVPRSQARLSSRTSIGGAAPTTRAASARSNNRGPTVHSEMFVGSAAYRAETSGSTRVA
jgi:hypothetical protein